MYRWLFWTFGLTFEFWDCLTFWRVSKEPSRISFFFFVNRYPNDVLNLCIIYIYIHTYVYIYIYIYINIYVDILHIFRSCKTHKETPLGDLVDFGRWQKHPSITVGSHAMSPWHQDGREFDELLDASTLTFHRNHRAKSSKASRRCYLWVGGWVGHLKFGWRGAEICHLGRAMNETWPDISASLLTVCFTHSWR